MNPLLVALGVLFLGLAVYAYTRPMDIRSWPSPREWQQNPRQAEEKQRTWAWALTVGFTAVGLLSLAAGLLVG